MWFSIQISHPLQRKFRFRSVIDAISEIKFEGGRVELCKKGVLKFTTAVDKLELAHAQNFMENVKKLNVDTQAVLLLFDAKSLNESTSGEVKKYVAGLLEEHAKALAVLNNSSIARFLIHTFQAIYRPNIPVRMFESEEEAKAWLVEFKGQ